MKEWFKKQEKLVDSICYFILTGLWINWSLETDSLFWKVCNVILCLVSLYIAVENFKDYMNSVRLRRYWKKHGRDHK